MLLDLKDLRSQNWIPRHDASGPKTIAEIHEEAQRAKEASEALRRTQSNNRGAPNMDQRQYANFGADSRQGGRPRRDSVAEKKLEDKQRKVSDLTGFGNLERAKTTGGGANVFGALSAGSKGWKKEEKEKATKTVIQNPFSALKMPEESTSPPKEERIRPKLNLQPRNEMKLTKQQAKVKIEGMVKEFHSINDYNEVVLCIKDLKSSEHHAEIVEQFVNSSLEKKIEAIERVGGLLGRLVKENVINNDSVVKGFGAVIELIEDVAIDIPGVYRYVGQMMYTAGVSMQDLVTLVQSLSHSPSMPGLKLLSEYLKALKDAEGEDGVARRVKQHPVNLRQLFPNKSDEQLADALERAGMFALNPPLKVVKHLKRSLGSEDVDDIITYFEENFTVSLRQSEEFIRVLTGAIFRHIAGQTIFPNGMKQPQEADAVKEKALVIRLARGLLSVYTIHLSNREVILDAVAAYSKEAGEPPGWKGRMVGYLVELNIVGSECAEQWQRKQS